LEKEGLPAPRENFGFAWPVNRDVGNVRNNRPDLVEPIVV
jgi:hypothetical protein